MVRVVGMSCQMATLPKKLELMVMF